MTDIQIGRSTPTVTAGAYASGDAVGGLLTFTGVTIPNHGKGKLLSVIVTLNSTQTPACDLFLFGGPFTATANGLAWNPSVTALANTFIGVVKITTGMWGAGAANSAATQWDINMAIKTTDDNPNGLIYGQLVARAVMTPATTTGVTVGIGVEVW